MHAGMNPKAILPTVTEAKVKELWRIASRLSDDGEPPKKRPKNNRCPHKFIDKGKGRCWICDQSVRGQSKLEVTGAMKRKGK